MADKFSPAALRLMEEEASSGRLGALTDVQRLIVARTEELDGLRRKFTKDEHYAWIDWMSRVMELDRLFLVVEGLRMKKEGP